jgi:hypothetical protein
MMCVLYGRTERSEFHDKCILRMLVYSAQMNLRVRSTLTSNVEAAQNFVTAT